MMFSEITSLTFNQATEIPQRHRKEDVDWIHLQKFLTFPEKSVSFSALTWIKSYQKQQWKEALHIFAIKNTMMKWHGRYTLKSIQKDLSNFSRWRRRRTVTLFLPHLNQWKKNTKRNPSISLQGTVTIKAIWHRREPSNLVSLSYGFLRNW